MSKVYARFACNLGAGLKEYLFTGDTKFSKVEAREINAKGDVIAVGGGISVPSKEYKTLLRASKPFQRTHFKQGV